MRVHRKFRIVLATALALVLLSTGVALAAVVKVLDTPKNEFAGTADDGYFAYTQSRAGKPYKLNVYLQPPGDRIKVNAAGTIAYYDNIEIGDPTYGDRLVFMQLSGGNRNIKFWDVAAGGRSNPPDGVNTDKVESKPSISGRYLLFGRGPASGGGYMTKVILFDLETGTGTVIDKAPANGIVFPGTVNGDWLSWTECSPSECWAWRHQISTDQTTEVPSSARLVYTSAIGQDGTVWYVQSAIGCGANVKLRRHEIGVGSTTVIDFPDGVDANVSDLDDSVDPRRLYFDRVRCSNVDNWGIYRVTAD